MKKSLLTILFAFCLSMSSSALFAQESSIGADSLSPAKRKLPVISVSTEPALVVALVLIPVIGLYCGWHVYDTGRGPHQNPAYLNRYFAATHDHEILALQKNFQTNRRIWRWSTAGALVAGFVGLGMSVNIAFNPNEPPAGIPAFVLSGALLVGGQIARGISFGSLRKAIDLYNANYTTQKPKVTLNVGLPSSTPAGVGVYLRF